MYTTYQLMSRNNYEGLNDVTLDDIAKQFQVELDRKEKNKLYCNSFCRLYPLMLKISKKYVSFSYEEKVEICTQCLLDALNVYKNPKIKFATFFYIVLDTTFKTHITKQHTMKRKVWTQTVTNQEKVNFILGNVCNNTDNERKLLKTIIDSDELSIPEKEYCACVLAGYDKVSELKTKLNLAERLEHIPVTNPMYDKTNNRLFNKVKSSLKVKLKDFEKFKK